MIQLKNHFLRYAILDAVADCAAWNAILSRIAFAVVCSINSCVGVFSVIESAAFSGARWLSAIKAILFRHFSKSLFSKSEWNFAPLGVQLVASKEIVESCFPRWQSSVSIARGVSEGHISCIASAGLRSSLLEATQSNCLYGPTIAPAFEPVASWSGFSNKLQNGISTKPSSKVALYCALSYHPLSFAQLGTLNNAL